MTNVSTSLRDQCMTSWPQRSASLASVANSVTSMTGTFGGVAIGSTVASSGPYRWVMRVTSSTGGVRRAMRNSSTAAIREPSSRTSDRIRAVTTPRWNGPTPTVLAISVDAGVLVESVTFGSPLIVISSGATFRVIFGAKRPVSVWMLATTATVSGEPGRPVVSAAAWARASRAFKSRVTEPA